MSAPARLAAALAALTTAAAVHAQTRVMYVDASAPAGGFGTSWDRAFNDLQQALDAISAPTLATSVEIRVAGGVYVRRHPPGAWGRFEAFLDVPQTTSGVNLSILGGFAGRRSSTPDARDFARTETILSGDTNGDDTPDFGNRSDNTFSVLSLYAQNVHDVLFEGITVSGGNQPPSSTSSLAGGLTIGFVNNYGSTRISRCRFVDNRGSVGGGGLQLEGDAWHTTVEHCEFAGNRALYGGAIHASSGTLTDCVIRNNSADRGGGVYMQDIGFPQFLRCLIADNSATDGGGVWLSGSAAWISDCLFVGNSATGVGGGLGFSIRQAPYFPFIANSTFTDNHAGWGGAAYLEKAGVLNSILWANTAAQAGPQISSTFNETAIFNSVLQGGLAQVQQTFGGVATGTDVIDQDPLFTSPGGSAGDYTPAAGSPCIDAARAPEPGWWLSSIDLTGFYRDGAPDLGALEYRRPCDPDLNTDGNADQDDVRYLVGVIAGAPNITGRDPDVNRDGNADQSDIAFLISIIAGAPCP